MCIRVLAVPSEVTLLCNNMPCGESVAVGDTVTCVAHGYPQPVFDLRIRNLSPEGDNSVTHGVGYAKMAIRGYEDLRIGLKNMGRVEITCNVSNELGWGYNSLVIEVKLSKSGYGTP